MSCLKDEESMPAEGFRDWGLFAAYLTGWLKAQCASAHVIAQCAALSEWPTPRGVPPFSQAGQYGESRPLLLKADATRVVYG